jgi:FlaA1/EpsC-like NDP-sugar epimerase
LSFADIEYEHITRQPPPKLELNASVASFFEGKTVVVTGAGGSIGGRIARFLGVIPNVNLLCVDRDENSLHSLSLSISHSALFQDTKYILLDIRDERAVENLFEHHKPNVVVHCAALKHLAVLEHFPREAILTNVIGTNNLLKFAKKHGTTNFLNVSTDKAANPTSILGKTKRIAELLVIGARSEGFKDFTNVRFGNVFNSKGSVIETFAFQIQNKIPITLTDPRMRRYFMHLDEASALALRSISLNAGAIHILDMGEPILMLDIIDRMKELFGSDQEVVITGKRVGEKLDEDLQSQFQKSRLTSEPRIRTLESDLDLHFESSGLKLDNDIDAMDVIERFSRYL